MRRIDIIKRAGRNLRQSKGRTVLTALAISVGAFTIGLALMAGEGGRLYTNSIVDAAGDKKVIMVKYRLSSQAIASTDGHVRRTEMPLPRKIGRAHV